MRKLFWLFVAVLAIVACTKKTPDYTVISGTVKNAKGMKELKIAGSYGFSDVIEIKEDGTFLDTLRGIKTGNYSFQMGRGGLPIYLEQGEVLKVEIDFLNRKAPISFLEGKSLPVNKYLSKKGEEAEKSIQELGGYQKIFGMEPNEFIATVDKISQKESKSLEAAENLPAHFVDLEKRAIKYNRLYSLSMYPQYHAYVTKKENYQAPESITKPFADLDCKNEKDYNEVEMYRQLVLSKFFGEYYEEDADKAAIVEKVKATGMKLFQKDFAAQVVSSLSLGAKDLKQTSEQIKDLTSDEKVIESLNAFLKTAEKLGQGNPSPSFTYKSIKGKEVSLADLKGKLVYIDVWATWCGPCKGELPYLQKLEKDYHRKAIHFVSVSVDQDKAAWEKMVKEQKLGGIQLHAEGAWQSDFVKSYEIKGIPRFILLDKSGNIISADAPRPSSDKIRTLINEWLKKK